MQEQQANNRDLYRSTLFHFQRGMPEIQTVNGQSKFNPAFAEYTKSQGIDYRFLDYDTFVSTVLQMLSTADVKGELQAEILANYKDMNDYLMQSWEQYIMQKQ